MGLRSSGRIHRPDPVIVRIAGCADWIIVRFPDIRVSTRFLRDLNVSFTFPVCLRLVQPPRYDGSLDQHDIAEEEEGCSKKLSMI